MLSLQVLSDTTDGKRYIDFYNVSEYPYLAVVDPRTGECMRTYKNITIDSLSAGLNDILSNHASPESNPEDRINVDQWNNYCSSQSSKEAVTLAN